ncbi:MAG: hypothetical protein GXY36_02845 [Chloroflexi bacterium]|nr:hypothetical protein [Chloroflexota bacterium]
MHICLRLSRVRLGLLWLAVLLLLPALALAAQDTDAVVSRVDGDAITREEFHLRLRFVRWQYLQELEKLYELTGGNLGLTGQYVESLAASLQDPAGLGDDVLAQMEEERLLWQAGERLDVAPTGDDIDRREAAFFALWTGVPVDDLAGDDEAQHFIADWYERAGAISGLERDALRAIFATEALRGLLLDHLGQSLPTEELAVRSRHILCAFHPQNVNDPAAPTTVERAAAQACVAEARARLAGGEPFADVAADLSDDASSAVQGGELGWIALGYLVKPYADAAETAALNTVIGPVETGFGLHLIEVLEREMQPVDPAEFEASKQGYFELWIAMLHDEATIERSQDWDAGLPVEPGLELLSPDVRDAVLALTQPAEEQR